jgi:hypothetical protein
MMSDLERERQTSTKLLMAVTVGLVHVIDHYVPPDRRQAAMDASQTVMVEMLAELAEETLLYVR